MVQPKYSPQDALERIKLMMKYDTSKTLNENLERIKLINEQKDTNILTDMDLLGQTSLLRQYFQFVQDFDAIYSPLGINIPNLVAGKRVGVKGVVDALDGWVNAEDLAYTLQILKGLDGKCYLDPVGGKQISATERFLQLYSEDEGGDDLKSDVQSVGTKTLPTGTEQIKQLILKTIDSQIAAGCKSAVVDVDCKQNPNQEKCKGVDCAKNPDDPKCKSKPTPRKSRYKNCTGTYSLYCKSPKIGEVQSCLGGLTADNAFGPKTLSKLKEKGFGESFTDADVAKICAKKEDKPEIGGEIEKIDVSEL